MALNNEGKYYSFQNGEILYGPSGAGQNLNEHLQQRMADEVDNFLRSLVGDGVIGAGGWSVSAGAGLSVNVSAGSGVIDGQIVVSSGIFAVPGLPASTAGIKIYAKAATPWSATLRGWALLAQAKTGALVTGEILLATVETNGSGVTGVTDGRRILTPVGELTEQKSSRARQAAAGVL